MHSFKIGKPNRSGLSGRINIFCFSGGYIRMKKTISIRVAAIENMITGRRPVI
jgi:hypothetical protein